MRKCAKRGKPLVIYDLPTAPFRFSFLSVYVLISFYSIGENFSHWGTTVKNPQVFKTGNRVIRAFPERTKHDAVSGLEHFFRFLHFLLAQTQPFASIQTPRNSCCTLPLTFFISTPGYEALYLIYLLFSSTSLLQVLVAIFVHCTVRREDDALLQVNFFIGTVVLVQISLLYHFLNLLSC